MPTVRHPRVPETTRRVSAAELPNWLAQGWIGPAEAETPPVETATAYVNLTHADDPTAPTEPDPAPTDAAPRRSNQRRHRGAASEGE